MLAVLVPGIGIMARHLRSDRASTIAILHLGHLLVTSSLQTIHAVVFVVGDDGFNHLETIARGGACRAAVTWAEIQGYVSLIPRRSGHSGRQPSDSIRPLLKFRE